MMVPCWHLALVFFDPNSSSSNDYVPLMFEDVLTMQYSLWMLMLCFNAF